MVNEFKNDLAKLTKILRENGGWVYQVNGGNDIQSLELKASVQGLPAGWFELSHKAFIVFLVEQDAKSVLENIRLEMKKRSDELRFSAVHKSFEELKQIAVNECLVVNPKWMGRDRIGYVSYDIYKASDVLS